MVVLSELSSLFVKISVCDALLTCNLFNNMHAKWMCYAFTKELEQLKLSSSTESATAKNPRKQCQMLRSLWRNKNN